MTQKPVPFPRRFLIPTDGGREATSATRIGLRLARALGASVRAVSVVDPQMVYRLSRLSSAQPFPLAEVEEEARAAVAAVAREACRLKVPCQTALREGPASAAILAEARAHRSGLLILGTRGHTGLKRLVLGPRSDPPFWSLSIVHPGSVTTRSPEEPKSGRMGAGRSWRRSMFTRKCGARLSRWFDRLDLTLVGLMSAYGVHLLRWAIASVYLWFGGLKLINASPAAELVVKTVFWLPPRAALMFIGGWEVLIGVGLLSTHPLALRATLLLLWLQAAGTFQVFFLLPQEAFQGGNPLLPTLEGQYAFKNLVLIAAGLVIGSTVRRLSRVDRMEPPPAPPLGSSWSSGGS